MKTKGAVKQISRSVLQYSMHGKYKNIYEHMLFFLILILCAVNWCMLQINWKHVLYAWIEYF